MNISYVFVTHTQKNNNKNRDRDGGGDSKHLSNVGLCDTFVQCLVNVFFLFKSRYYFTICERKQKFKHLNTSQTKYGV